MTKIAAALLPTGAGVGPTVPPVVINSYCTHPVIASLTCGLVNTLRCTAVQACLGWFYQDNLHINLLHTQAEGTRQDLILFIETAHERRAVKLGTHLSCGQCD